jgi:hypothetical protein
MKRYGCLALLLLLTACGQPGTTPRPVRSGANTISREEIVGFHASDVLRFIEVVRPSWVRAQGSQTGPDVYVGSSRAGGLRDLRYYRPMEFESIEYLSSSQAEFRFPDARGRPVIVLIPHEP